jgi:dihydrofolate reductase
MKRSLLPEEEIDQQKEKPMRNIIFLIHLSLDGFTATPNDELDWIAYDHELEQDAHALHDRTDAVIWGRRTYELMAGYWLTVPGNPASSPAELEHARFLDNATKIVVSRTLERVAWNNAQNTVLIKNHIAEEINAIKQQPGKDIWLLGSPTLAQTFMQLDLIDEYRININPTMLGQGRALFAGVTRPFPLKLLESKTFQSGVVALRYAPERPAKAIAS